MCLSPRVFTAPSLLLCCTVTATVCTPDCCPCAVHNRPDRCPTSAGCFAAPPRECSSATTERVRRPALRVPISLLPLSIGRGAAFLCCVTVTCLVPPPNALVCTTTILACNTTTTTHADALFLPNDVPPQHADALFLPNAVPPQHADALFLPNAVPPQHADALFLPNAVPPQREQRLSLSYAR
jgi:hypothetical protein